VFIAAGVLACGFLWWRIPSPGVSAAIMGAAAAIMTARTTARGPEKTAWMIIIFVLLVIEVLAIKKERVLNQIAERNRVEEERSNFSNIGEGIKTTITQSQEQFKETTIQASSQFDATMTKAQENLNHMTGGSSYPRVDLVPIPMTGTINKMRLAFTVDGKNPLFDVDVTLQTSRQPSVMNATDFLTTGNIQGHIHELSATSVSGNRAEVLPVPVEPSLTSQSEYQIVTIARNGTFVETLRVRHLAAMTPTDKGLWAEWEQSLEITRGTGKSQRLIKKVPWHKTLLSGANIRKSTFVARLTPQASLCSAAEIRIDGRALPHHRRRGTQDRLERTIGRSVGIKKKMRRAERVHGFRATKLCKFFQLCKNLGTQSCWGPHKSLIILTIEVKKYTDKTLFLLIKVLSLANNLN